MLEDASGGCRGGSRCSLVALIIVSLLSILTAGRVGAGTETATTLTLERAVQLARKQSPDLAAHRAAVEAARGRLLTARTYPANPRLSVRGAERSGPRGSSTDRGLTLSQRLELAGQSGKRSARAQQALEAAEARLGRGRRELRAAVERAFAAAVAARELQRVAEADRELTRRLLDFEVRRLEEGAGTRIALNLARAAAGRAEHRVQQAVAAAAEARARLAETVGLKPDRPPRLTGSLPSTLPAVPGLEELLAAALAHRSDLKAARREVERAERTVALERSLRIPDLRVGLSVGREEGDDISGLEVGIGLPLFDRNQGGIATAAARLAVRRRVAAAHARYRATAAALEALDELVVDTLEESLELLELAMETGEVSATDVLVLRRELVGGRREAIEAAREGWLARVALELATAGAMAGAAVEPTQRPREGEEESR